LATATPMHSTFFSWNLMEALVSFTCKGTTEARRNASQQLLGPVFMSAGKDVQHATTHDYIALGARHATLHCLNVGAGPCSACLPTVGGA
jgi:hypothetical protein